MARASSASIPTATSMFNPPVKQLRDKKGHPAFDPDGKPGFQTATDLGYDEKGKKIPSRRSSRPDDAGLHQRRHPHRRWLDRQSAPQLRHRRPQVHVCLRARNRHRHRLAKYLPGAKEQPAAFNGKSSTLPSTATPSKSRRRNCCSARSLSPRGSQSIAASCCPPSFPSSAMGGRPQAAVRVAGRQGHRRFQGANSSAASAPRICVPTLLLAPCPCRHDAPRRTARLARPERARPALRAHQDLRNRRSLGAHSAGTTSPLSHK
jgi:hypothetical protein